MSVIRPWACLILAAALQMLLAAVHAADVAGSWRVQEGHVAWEVSHLMHSALGRSTQVRGLAECEAARCTFRLRVPVASFASGDADRDESMRAAVQAQRYPMARVEGTGRLVSDDAAVVQGQVVLAGQRAPLEPVRFHVERGWWSLSVRGTVSFDLSALGIERPALLGIPIEDTVLVHVQLVFGPA